MRLTLDFTELVQKRIARCHYGTVNLLKLARTLPRSAERNARSRRAENPAYFSPGRKGAHPGFSILNGGNVIATEVEEIVDWLRIREE